MKNASKSQDQIQTASNGGTSTQNVGVDDNSVAHDIFVTGDTHVETTSSKQVDLSVGNVEASVQKLTEKETPDDPKDHKLDDMFGAWVELGSTVWTPDQQPPGPDQWENEASILSFDVPEKILQDDLVNRKVAHHAFMTADVEIELKVNALPTQSGLLFLTLFPFISTEGKDGPYIRLRNSSSLAGVTSISGVYLNIEDTSSVRFTIPYNHPFAMLCLNGQYDQVFGSVGVIPIAPLLGPTTSEKVYVTMFGRLTNVKLYGPCNNPNPTTYAVPLTCEIGKENDGWKVSDIANTISNVSGALSKVPVIGEVASGVSWFSRMVGTAAAAIGFSKPNIQAAPNFIVSMATYGLQFVQGYIPSVSVGAIQDNEIANDLQGEDEMSIAYLARQEAVLESYPMGLDAPANAPGKVLSTFFVTPLCNALTSKTHVYPSPLAFAAKFFYYWRGSITYRFRFIKTKFHKGRLRVTFEPGNFSLADDAPAYNRAYTTLIDLSSTSEVTFEVPFISSQEWLETALTSSDGNPAWWWNNSTGRVTLSVVNPIIGPDSVSRYITVVTSMYSEDMQFAGPIMEFSDVPIVDEEQIEFESEVGETTNPITMKPNHDIVKFTMGENISSLRLLTRKFRSVGTLSQSGVVMTSRLLVRDPLATAYALWRGSTRVGIPADTVPFRNQTRDAFVLYGDYEQEVTPEQAITHMLTSSLEYPIKFGKDFSQLTIPFYSNLRSQLIKHGGTSSDHTDRVKRSGVYVPVIGKAEGVMMAAGDDFTYCTRVPLVRFSVPAVP